MLSWCTAAETAISNLETEHGITNKGSRGPTVRKSPLLSVQQFRVQVAIPYLDTLIANINSRFSCEVVVFVVSTQLFFQMMRHFSPLMRHFSLLMRHFSPLMRHFSPLMRHFSLLMRHFSLLMRHFSESLW